jgi:hypothetical protein
MSLPSLNGNFELRRSDFWYFIFNFIIGLFFGRDVIFVMLGLSFIFIIIAFILTECFRRCCLPDERQAVFVPYGRQPYD